MWNKNNPSWWWCKLKSNTSAWIAVYPDGEYSIWTQEGRDPVCAYSNVAENMEQAVKMVEQVAENKGYKKA